MTDAGGYERIVKELAADGSRSDREKEIERVFDEAMPRILSRVLDENNGSKRPALRQMNDRLREHAKYDDESNGVVSPNTFYDWIDRYDGTI